MHFSKLAMRRGFSACRYHSLSQVLQFQPQNTALNLFKALALEGLGNYEEAINTAQGLKTPEAQKILLRCYESSGNTSKIVELLEDLRKQVDT